jgi:hypothetical protein
MRKEVYNGVSGFLSIRSKMNIKLEIKLAKQKVSEEGFSKEEIVNYLAERKVYHSVAILIFSNVFEVNDVISSDFIYAHAQYSPFKFEENPFNEDFINE